MSDSLSLIRIIQIGGVRVLVEAVPEDWSPEQTLKGTAHDGDDEILRKIYDGRLKHFAVRVTVQVVGTEGEFFREEVARRYLGGCIYPKYTDFRESPYLQQMVLEAMDDARDEIDSIFGGAPAPGDTLRNGATVLAAEEYDDGRWLVACWWRGEYVSWVYHEDDGATVLGRYYDSAPHFWEDYAGRLRERSQLDAKARRTGDPTNTPA